MQSIFNESDNNNVVALQQHLIDQTTNPHVTKIRGAPCKKRIKSAIELSEKKNAIREITSQANIQETNSEEASRSQRKCLLCGKPGHYQKKCPKKRSTIEEN